MIMDQSPQVGIYASQHIYAYKSRDTTYTPITLATSRNDLLMYNTGFLFVGIAGDLHLEIKLAIAISILLISTWS